jgi:hypothetical protein
LFDLCHVTAPARRCIVLRDKLQMTSELQQAMQEKLDWPPTYVKDAEMLEQLGGLRNATAQSQVALIVFEAFEDDAEIKLALAGGGLGAYFLNMLTKRSGL